MRPFFDTVCKVYIKHMSESVLLNKIGRKSNTTNETNECCFINNLIFGDIQKRKKKRGRETQLLCQSR